MYQACTRVSVCRGRHVFKAVTPTSLLARKLKQEPHSCVFERTLGHVLGHSHRTHALKEKPQIDAVCESFIEAQLVGKYTYDEHELETIEEFTKTMRDCGTAFAAVAVGNVLVALFEAQGHGMEVPEHIVAGLTVGDFAYLADSILLCYLIFVAEAPFETIARDKDNQLAHTFQGINRLTLIFQQLAIASATVGIVTTLEAAVKWPPLVVTASVTFFGAAVVRSLATWWVLNRHASTMMDVKGTLRAMNRKGQLPLLDRWAVRVAFGYLAVVSEPLAKRREPGYLPSNLSSATLDSLDTPSYDAEAPSSRSYTFSGVEETFLRSLMDAASTAGIALSLQAFATALLVVASFFSDDYSNAISNSINAVNKAAAATFIFTATSSFDSILYGGEDECDVFHFLQGLGEGGLQSMFERLTVLAWAVTFAEGATLLAPWLEKSPLTTLATEGVAEKLADFWIRIFGKVLAGVL